MRKITKSILSILLVFSLLIGTGIDLFVVSNQTAYASDVDVTSNVTAVAIGNKMIKLTWDYTPVEGTLSDYQYLIYRSTSEDGTFTNVGYTSKGVMEYTDAGGKEGELTAGTTYYYKIQAYDAANDISSNTYYAPITSATAVAQAVPENEFILEGEKQEAINYIIDRIKAKDTTVSVDIWLDSTKISGYAGTLFKDMLATVSSSEDEAKNILEISGYTSALDAPRIIRNGLNFYTITYTPAYVTADVTTNVTAVPINDRMVKLTWDYTPPLGANLSDYQYLIFRSTSENGNYDNVGYTEKGVMQYIDAGGEDGVLSADVTYYYKVQAYNPDKGLSSNLYYSEIVAATPVAKSQGENEFVLENEKDQAVQYLKDALIARESKIVLNIWLDDEKIAGYSKVLFDEAVKETESPTSFNEGDYLWLHLAEGGYDCKLSVHRIIRNGLHLYTLTYTPSYYSTAEQEAKLEATVDDIIANKLNLSDNATDFEKVQAVYEYLSEGATYDLSLQENGLPRCSAYNSIVEKRAVCQGYSNGAYYILKKLGINNRIITGDVYYDGEWRVHAWNLVEIDDEWYNLCITTEVHMRENVGFLSYRYLLKTDDDKYFSIFRRDEQFSNSTFVNTHPMTDESYVVIPTAHFVSVPQSVNATPKSGVTMSLSWSKTAGAYSYEIWRSTSEDGKYVRVKETTGLSTSDTGLRAGTRYYYKVRIKRILEDDIYWGNFSEPVAAVALATPTIASTKVSGNGITLTWSKASGADRYNIYRSTNPNSGFEYINSVQNVLTYTDTENLESGKTYYYKVRAYKKYDGIVYYGQYSDAKSLYYIDTPELTVTPSSGVTMKLSWEAVPGAKYYEIYTSTDGKNFTYLKATNSLSTSHGGRTAGTRYWYCVRPYTIVNGENVYGDYSEVKAAVALATPTIEGISASVDGITLNWSKASGADRYNIYRSASPNGGFEYIDSVQNVLTYTDTKNLESGKTYYYMVRAYKKYDGVVYYGQNSAAKSLYYIAAPQLTVTPSSGVTMKLSWNAVQGAKYYEVYCSTDGVNFTYVKATNGLSTSHGGRVAGTRYWYYVRPFVIVNGENVYGADSPIKAAVALATPTIESVNVSDEGITLSWTKASGADRYNIYRSTDPNSGFEYIESVQNVLTYTDTDELDTSKTYYYKVRAYKKYDGIVYYGQYSDAK